MSLLKENTKTKLCKKCLKKPRMIGRRLCLSCVSMDLHLRQKEQKAKKKEREKKLILCLRCKKNKRYKRKKKVLTVCRSCFLETDVEYWADKAWSAFAKWLKKELVWFTCYTCGKTLPIEQAQAGHCFHRGNARYKAIDFDPKHIHLQCGGCNCFSTVQTNIFQAKLTRELGIEEVEKMIWRRNNEPPLTIEELKELIARYTVDN